MIAAVFAAFPQELKHIARPEERFSPSREKQRSSCGLIAVQTGMGARNVENAFLRLLEERRPDIVLSVGFGGALYEGARVGEIVWSTRALLFGKKKMEQAGAGAGHDVSGHDLGRRIGEKLADRTGAREGSIVTVPEMTGKPEVKTTLPSDLPLPVCDMETFYLARLSQQNRVPFLALRAVTDRLHEELPPELLAVTDGTGRYRFSRALGLLIARPTLIPAGIKLGRSAARASRSLGKAVDTVMEILPAFAPPE